MSAYGHNGEVLVARLTLRADGSCAMRVTADLDGNYLLRDREKMAEAMPELFLLSTDSGTRPFAESAGEPSFSSASKLETDSPFQHTPEELAKTYRLENAEWQWTPGSRNFVLKLPEGSPHTVLLWMIDESRPGEKSRWTMMVAGDESPLITVHAPTTRSETPWWLTPEVAEFLVIFGATAATMLLIRLALRMNRIGEWLDRKPRP
jgi:hypothetical protein